MTMFFGRELLYLHISVRMLHFCVREEHRFTLMNNKGRGGTKNQRESNKKKIM